MTQPLDLFAPPGRTTPPPVPDSTTIAAPGHPIALIDGATVHLRYSMASLRMIEDLFGSLVGVQDRLQEASEALQVTVPEGATEQQAAAARREQAKGKVFTILSDAIAAGLLHVRVVHPDTGQRVRLGTDRDLVMEQLDPGQLQPYLQAFAAALTQAFGGEGKATGEAMAAAVSPGDSGTTWAPSSGDAPNGSSGA